MSLSLLNLGCSTFHSLFQNAFVKIRSIRLHFQDSLSSGMTFNLMERLSEPITSELQLILNGLFWQTNGGNRFNSTITPLIEQGIEQGFEKQIVHTMR